MNEPGTTQTRMQQGKEARMRKLLIGLVGVFLLLTRFALPTGVSAAPALAVSPGSGPRGTATGISAGGLAPATNHLVQLARGSGNTNTTRLFEDTAWSDARGELHYRLAVDQEPGAYTVRIVALGGAILATAPFTVTPGQSMRTIVIAPDRGPCSTQPVLSGAGFPPRAAVAIYQQRLGARGETIGVARLVTTVQAGSGGGLPPFTVPTLGADCRDAAPATPGGTRILFTAVWPGASPDAATEPERRAVFTIDRGAAQPGQYFPETGFGVEGRFLAYFRSHGLSFDDPGISTRESLALFGYPISGELEQRLEDGKVHRVQYFERARMEYHPENEAPYDVLLGQFGRQIVAAVPGAPVAPVADASHGRYFPQTGHNVHDGAFLDFWALNGGLPVFGYPLSEEFWQILEDGRQYKVQYFERARLEFHAERAGSPYEVQLGQFGRQILGPTGGPGVPR
jgi:hypothetical protein